MTHRQWSSLCHNKMIIADDIYGGGRTSRTHFPVGSDESEGARRRKRWGADRIGRRLCKMLISNVKKSLLNAICLLSEFLSEWNNLNDIMIIIRIIWLDFLLTVWILIRVDSFIIHHSGGLQLCNAVGNCSLLFNLRQHDKKRRDDCLLQYAMPSLLWWRCSGYERDPHRGNESHDELMWFSRSAPPRETAFRFMSRMMMIELNIHTEHSTLEGIVEFIMMRIEGKSPSRGIWHGPRSPSGSRGSILSV